MKIFCIFWFLFMCLLGYSAYYDLHPHEIKDYEYSRYKLNSGEIVDCSKEFHGRCGLDLCGCKNHKVYKCLNNVQKIG